MFDPYDFEEITLDSGVKVFLKQLDYASKVNIGIVVMAGGRDGEPGIAHLLEHCLSHKAGAFLGVRGFQKAIYPLGGKINLGMTGRTAMKFKGEISLGKEALLFEVLSALLTIPAFPKGRIANEKRVVKNEILDHVHSVDFVTKAEMMKLSAFEDEYKEAAKEVLGKFNVLGRPEEIGRLGRAKIIKFHRTCFVPERTSVVLAGNLNRQKIFGLLKQHSFALGPGQRQQHPIPSRKLDCGLPLVPKNEVVEISAKELMQTKKNVVDYCTIELNAVLAPDRRMLIGPFARTFRDMIFNLHRKKRGRTYSPTSSYTQYDDALLFHSVIKTAPGGKDLLIDDIREAIDLSINHRRLFDEMKTEMVNEYDSFNESSAMIRDNAMQDVMNFGKVLSFEKERQCLKDMTFAAYRKYAEQVADSIAVCVVNP